MQKQSLDTKIKLSYKAQYILIFLCWAVYTVAYIGRYSYTANVVPIMKFYTINEYEFSLATTFFFFAYGAGQILNGIFCRRYNMKYMIAGALSVSAIINGLVFFGLPFEFIKYIWLINGLCQSVLWASLLRILSCYLDDNHMNKAVIIMSTPVAIGTLLVYGLSALFAHFNAFKLTFLLGFFSMGVIGLIWFIYFPILTKRSRLENLSAVSMENEQLDGQVKTQISKRNSFFRSGLLYMLILFCVYAIVSNYVKDGLTTWVPRILNKQYSLDDSLSIILTLVLPVLGLCGAIAAVFINKFVKNHSDLLGVFFALSAVTIFGIQLLFKTDLWYLALLLFGLLSLFMNGANNVITNMFPLHVGKKYNSGLIAGLLNGACYVGSTLSQYLIAVIVIAGDWNAVINVFFYLCIGITAFSILIFLVRMLFSKKVNKL